MKPVLRSPRHYLRRIVLLSEIEGHRGKAFRPLGEASKCSGSRQVELVRSSRLQVWQAIAEAEDWIELVFNQCT